MYMVAMLTRSSSYPFIGKMTLTQAPPGIGNLITRRIYPTGVNLNAALLRTEMADIKRDFDGNITRNHSVDWTNFGVSADQLTEVEYKRRDRMLLNVNSACYGRRLCWMRGACVGITPAVSEVR